MKFWLKVIIVCAVMILLGILLYLICIEGFSPSHPINTLQWPEIELYNGTN